MSKKFCRDVKFYIELRIGKGWYFFFFWFNLSQTLQPLHSLYIHALSLAHWVCVCVFLLWVLECLHLCSLVQSFTLFSTLYMQIRHKLFSIHIHLTEFEGFFSLHWTTTVSVCNLFYPLLCQIGKKLYRVIITAFVLFGMAFFSFPFTFRYFECVCTLPFKSLNRPPKSHFYVIWCVLHSKYLGILKVFLIHGQMSFSDTSTRWTDSVVQYAILKYLKSRCH